MYGPSQGQRRRLNFVIIDLATAIPPRGGNCRIFCYILLFGTEFLKYLQILPFDITTRARFLGKSSKIVFTKQKPFLPSIPNFSLKYQLSKKGMGHVLGCPVF